MKDAGQVLIEQVEPSSGLVKTQGDGLPAGSEAPPLVPLCQCASLNASVGLICSSAGDHQSLCECVAPLTPVHPLVAER